MLLGIISILLLVLATGFFVASEFALVSVRKTRVEQLISEGNKTAGLIKQAIDHLQNYIAATQIGITMASLGLGALGEPVLAQIFVPFLEKVVPQQVLESFVSAHGFALAISFLIVTILEIVLGELVPKIYARQRAEATVMFIIRPMNIFLFIFRPLIWLINIIGNMVLRLVGLRAGDEHANVHSVEELEMLVVSSRQAGVLEEEEEAILRRVFDLSEVTVRQVMLPRTEMSAISVDATLAQVITELRKDRHSRYPVYEGDVDKIIGVLHVKDIFLLLADALASNNGKGTDPVVRDFNVRLFTREILKIPETVDVNVLLPRMRETRIHMAVVIDEYGGTAGIVTLEDLVEEIVGEVRDEFEVGEDKPDFQSTPEGILVNGLTALTDASEQLGLDIQSDADTVGGFVFQQLGRKPELGDEVRVNGYLMRVEELDGLRIATVRVAPTPDAAVAGGDDE